MTKNKAIAKIEEALEALCEYCDEDDKVAQKSLTQLEQAIEYVRQNLT